MRVVDHVKKIEEGKYRAEKIIDSLVDEFKIMMGDSDSEEVFWHEIQLLMAILHLLLNKGLSVFQEEFDSNDRFWIEKCRQYSIGVG